MHQRIAVHKHSKRMGLVGLLAICVPMAMVVLPAVLAYVLGCDLSSPYQRDCILISINLGKFLASMYATGWVLMIFVPVGIALTAIAAIWVVIAAHLRKRRIRKR